MTEEEFCNYKGDKGVLFTNIRYYLHTLCKDKLTIGFNDFLEKNPKLKKTNITSFPPILKYFLSEDFNNTFERFNPKNKYPIYWD